MLTIDNVNILSNIKLLQLIQRYLDFQKENGYPLSENIIIENLGGVIEFSLLPTVSVDPSTPITDQFQADLDGELDTFDEFIDQIIDDLTDDEDGIYVNKKLSRVSDYAVPILDHHTRGLFKCEHYSERLNTFHTGSLTEKNSKYYLSVYNNAIGTANSYHQFDITYGHISGSGSSYVQTQQDLYPSKTMYRKYLVDCFGTNSGKIPFKNGKNGDYFYAIQIDRELFNDRLDAGNFELSLSPLSSSSDQLVNTGSNFYSNPSSSTIFTLIDESGDTKEYVTEREGISEYYYITSGSFRDGVYGEPEDDAWGIVFPKKGLIILDGVVMDHSCSFNTVTASIDGDNIRKLFVSISGSSSPNAVRTTTGSFFARSVDDRYYETYFCRSNYYEFNYSNNPTYVTGSNGEIKNLGFRREPNTYITTIGLYNRRGDLLAIGKLRNPVLKNEGSEYIFQVRVRLN